MLRFDHVIVAVADLDEAARRLEGEYGLASLPGGTHPAFGTANRIAPVGGGAYVELMAVHDPDLAATSPIGRWVRATLEARGDAVNGWMLAPDDLDGTSARLGLGLVPGERRLPDGGAVRWRLAGIDAMLDDPPLPAFIAWDVPADQHPSAMAGTAATATATATATGITWVEVAGEAARARLDDWLGSEATGLEVRRSTGEGPPGLVAVGIGRPDGTETVLR